MFQLHTDQKNSYFVHRLLYAKTIQPPLCPKPDPFPFIMHFAHHFEAVFKCLREDRCTLFRAINVPQSTLQKLS